MSVPGFKFKNSTRMLSEIEQLPKKKNNGVKSMKGIMMLLLNTDFVG